MYSRAKRLSIATAIQRVRTLGSKHTAERFSAHEN